MYQRLDQPRAYIGVFVNGAPITVTSDYMFPRPATTTATFSTSSNYVMVGSAYDFGVTEAGGRILGFSVVTYIVNDTCVAAGTVTDLKAPA